MKIVFPTDGDKLEDEICFHFGKAKNFLVFDIEQGGFKVYPNPETRGEKVLPPIFLKELGVDAVICFGLGSKAIDLFKNYGIETKRAKERIIKENINLFRKGELKNLTGEDIF